MRLHKIKLKEIGMSRKMVVYGARPIPITPIILHFYLYQFLFVLNTLQRGIL